MYDFETLSPPRSHHFWNALGEKGILDPGIISYGVAEMKFPLCPEIKKGLTDCAEYGYFGYYGDMSFADTACRFYARRHGWDAKPEWVVHSYGVVLALSMAIRSLTRPGDGIIIQTPVYNHFAGEVIDNGRLVLENKLIKGESRYEMNFEELEELAARPEAKMMILCSPHNPVGRVWSREELQRLSEICLKHNVLVVSDEIHNDLVYEGRHTVYAALSPEAEQNSIICTAPSKTFNIPGLITSNIFIPNPDIREKFAAEARRSTGHFLNITGTAAATAAFEKGDAWLAEALDYIKGNAEVFYTLVREKLPRAWTPKMEGTYLAWLDLSFLGLSDGELEKFLLAKAQILANMGIIYGENGSGFVRLNIACPRRYVVEAIERIAAAVNTI